MRIICPVDTVAETRELAALGAREFYGGFLTAKWKERFTLSVSPNRRHFPEAQIGDEKTLREIVGAAHDAGATFALTVNGPFYPREQMAPLLEIISRAVDAGADALIAADVGLLLEVRARWPGLPLHLSTLAEVSNTAAAAFYRRLGIERITLPRHLTIGEIEDIVGGSAGLIFDVIVLYGQCANAEGLCTFSHDHPRRQWPCVQHYRVAGRGGEEEIPVATAAAIGGQMLWGGQNRGEACGLCALHDLHRLGIEGVKIVGRGTSPQRKKWAVEAVTALTLLLESRGAGREDFMEEARRLYRGRFSRGCRPALCYFPELMAVSGG